MRILHAAFRTFIDVMHVQRDEAGRMFTVAAAREEADKAAAAAGGGGGSKLAGRGASTGGAPPSTSLPPSSPVRSGAAGGSAAGGGFFGEDAAEVRRAVQLGAATDAEVAERERRILALSADPRLYERLVASLAPNIYGMDDVKRGLLCQLFGGQVRVAWPNGMPGVFFVFTHVHSHRHQAHIKLRLGTGRKVGHACSYNCL
jgi:DNA replication licensing factor MCM4